MADERYDIDLDRDSGLVSVGTHLFKVIDCKKSINGSGFPNWAFDCVCQDAGPDQGMHVRLNVSHSPAAAWKKNEFLDALDAPRKGKSGSSVFFGKLFRGVVTHETYNNKPQAVISTCISVDTPIPTDVSTTVPGTQPSVRSATPLPADVVKKTNVPF